MKGSKPKETVACKKEQPNGKWQQTSALRVRTPFTFCCLFFCLCECCTCGTWMCNMQHETSAVTTPQKPCQQKQHQKRCQTARVAGKIFALWNLDRSWGLGAKAESQIRNQESEARTSASVSGEKLEGFPWPNPDADRHYLAFWL